MVRRALPLIGITTNGKSEFTIASKHYKDFYSTPAPYVDAVRRAGGIPVLLPQGESHWQELVNALDGIIFAGGADVEPIHYDDQLTHPEVHTFDTERDKSELAMARYLLATDKPILAVCRGMQLVNVARGGTLHPHIADFLDVDIHRKNGVWNLHDISIEANSHLADVIGATSVHTYSGHHQAVNRLGEGLRVVASAPDGIVEAVEDEGHPWLLAVQWHPEKSAHEDATQQRLFDALVKASHHAMNAHLSESAI
jgi:putative glutamine amidotransferase